jgi:alanyl-tRNA synthetase
MTVFSEDVEAYNLWKKITGFSDNKIIKISTNDNFWSMGDTGPCGPCSEIFYDHGEQLNGGLPGTKEQDGDRYIEIWNLVFMQFEQISKEKRINLPKPSVDTGMGLERMAAVMQGTHDNYQIDLFKNIISFSEDLIKKKISKDNTPSYRVIADHLRATAFLISDGVTPSNEGRGYVLRRIMRRAMRHVHTLGKSDPVLYKILPCLVNLMKDEYPQLLLAQELIHETLFTEEEKFSSLLKNGLKILDAEIQSLNNNTLPGNIAFKLYDTYGFPVDLIEDVLKEKKIIVDNKEFEKIVNEKKLQARASWKGIGSKGIDKIWYEIKEKFGPTEFLGYNFEKSEGKILAIVKNGQLVSSAKTDDEVMVVFNQTPFYAESGGQIGDNGKILFENNICEIFDTQKFFGDLFVHFGKIKSGIFSESNEVSLIVDTERRNKIKSYHSATHLLHAALREILGKHVSQKGSYVGPDRLRFDFSHSQFLKKDELAKINQRVNDVISSGGLVQTKIMSPARAIELGAMALFGEKYGDEVRVVSMGKLNDKVFSVELCGGIHVNNLSEIGDFEVINETSIASGIRRVEALRNQELKKYKFLIENQHKEKEINQKQQIQDLKNKIVLLKGDPEKFSDFNDDERIVKLKEFFEKLKKNVILKDPKKNIIYDHNFDSFLVRFQSIHGLPAKDLREIVDNAKKEQKNLLIFVFSNFNNKLSLAVGASGNCLIKFDSCLLAKKISLLINGKGAGGRRDFAQSGGEPQKDLSFVYEFIKDQIDKNIN